MTVWRTRDGDVADRIARETLGGERHVTRLLAANPGLAARGPVLPAGVEIAVPEPVPEPPRQGLRLWGAR